MSPKWVDRHAVRGDHPGDLRVARPVRGRQSRDPEWPDLDALPRLDHLRVEARLAEPALSRLERGGLQSLAGRRGGAEHGSTRPQRALQRGGVRVVGVQVRDEREVGGPGRRRERRLGCADELLQPGRVLQQVDEGGLTLGLELEPGPTETADSHGGISL